jgi:hypothetical protein
MHHAGTAWYSWISPPGVEKFAGIWIKWPPSSAAELVADADSPALAEV